MRKNILRVLFLLVILMINIYLVPILWQSSVDSFRVPDDILALVDVDDENPNIDKLPIKELQEQYNNKDIKAIMTIENTDYSTVVVQSDDNDYYLYRDVNKKSDGLGTPFLDYRADIDSSKKLLIFAHNSRYKDMPFKILENYYSKDYYKEHDYITITTDEGTRYFQIFSVYVDTSDFSYYKMDFNTESEWYNHIKTLKSKSMYNTGVEVSKNDNIIILQTCSTLPEYSSYAHKFLVVMAKEVE